MRTYVAHDGDRLAGFCSLAGGRPDPVPVLLLGLLAIDADYQGQRLGSDLLVDAGRHVLTTTKVVGTRAILVRRWSGRRGSSTASTDSGSSPTANRSCWSCGVPNSRQCCGYRQHCWLALLGQTNRRLTASRPTTFHCLILAVDAHVHQIVVGSQAAGKHQACRNDRGG